MINEAAIIATMKLPKCREIIFQVDYLMDNLLTWTYTELKESIKG